MTIPTPLLAHIAMGFLGAVAAVVGSAVLAGLYWLVMA